MKEPNKLQLRLTLQIQLLEIFLGGGCIAVTMRAFVDPFLLHVPLASNVSKNIYSF